jgi:hypothetical protein
VAYTSALLQNHSARAHKATAFRGQESWLDHRRFGFDKEEKQKSVSEYRATTKMSFFMDQSRRKFVGLGRVGA